MLLVKLDTGFNIEVEFPISPFHKRLFAWLIDMFICWIYLELMTAIIDVPMFGVSWQQIVIAAYRPWCISPCARSP